MAETDMGTLLVKMATTFERISMRYADSLTAVKDHALRNKAQCEQCVTDLAQKHQRLADTVQTHLDKVQGLIR